MKTINITIDEMIRNRCLVAHDQLSDAEPDMLDALCHSIKFDLRALKTKNMINIRQMFVEGQTVLLMGAKIDDVENCEPLDEMEIRIRDDDGKLLGVIIDSEIVY